MHATVCHLDDVPMGSLRLVRVGDHRICLVHTSDGVHALDHACPHEAYGLTQGSLSGNLLTCAWHNWKFDVRTGECVLGEEGVRTHQVDVTPEGDVVVTLRIPSADELRPGLLASLRRGVERDYVGQIARDAVRLLRADTNPGELVWTALDHGIPRSEFGWGHAVASATDCLSMLSDHDGDGRALPIVQAIAGLSEEARDRPVQPLPDPASDAIDRATFLRHVQSEELAAAQSIVRGAIHAGTTPAELRDWFTGAVSAHLLSYGHGAIYAQKAFELLDVIGWERADTVLTHLVPTIVYGTREDTLPYMRPFMKALGAADLRSLAHDRDTWADDGTLVAALLDTPDRTRALHLAVAALADGASLDAILDAVVDAVSRRMLRYDVAGERDLHDDFGWLDITHGLTYANAARWHVAHTGPTPDTVRLVLFTVFLAHWTGRHEWHTRIAEEEPPTLETASLVDAARALRVESLLDRTSSFIVHAHGVKMSVAATQEALRRGTALPLQATARFLRAPRLERFVAANVTRAIDMVNGRTARE